tara:strand:+ start:2448 stop:2828 length:381 start_codon:yes stop_codon:yes gene_type:complete
MNKDILADAEVAFYKTKEQIKEKRQEPPTAKNIQKLNKLQQQLNAQMAYLDRGGVRVFDDTGNPLTAIPPEGPFSMSASASASAPASASRKRPRGMGHGSPFLQVGPIRSHLDKRYFRGFGMGHCG